MDWIYLSPHFDDVALSCGGLVWEQVQRGEHVAIWTICAGEPPSTDLSPFASQLHTRWELGHNAPAERQVEDQKSTQYLGAASRTFTIPDCIYRRDPATGEYMYASEAALNGMLQPGDSQVIQNLQGELKHLLEAGTTLVSPLGLGQHVDHQLTRRAAEGLGQNRWYYADFPYVLRDHTWRGRMEAAGWASQVFSISPAGLAAWTASIAAHASQISTFWENEVEMQRSVAEYLDSEGGIRLWKRPVA